MSGDINALAGAFHCVPFAASRQALPSEATWHHQRGRPQGSLEVSNFQVAAAAALVPADGKLQRHPGTKIAASGDRAGGTLRWLPALIAPGPTARGSWRVAQVGLEFQGSRRWPNTRRSRSGAWPDAIASLLLCLELLHCSDSSATTAISRQHAIPPSSTIDSDIFLRKHLCLVASRSRPCRPAQA